jgi:hypothetical protein
LTKKGQGCLQYAQRAKRIVIKSIGNTMWRREFDGADRAYRGTMNNSIEPFDARKACAHRFVAAEFHSNYGYSASCEFSKLLGVPRTGDDIITPQCEPLDQSAPNP